MNMPDTIVTLPDIPVMFVAGDPARPIAAQAPDAFRRLEAALPSLKGRRFYGAVLGREYRACVALQPTDDRSALPHPIWSLPGGCYVRRRLADWERHVADIAPAFATLCARPDSDPSRPCLEHYRSRRELFLLAPIRGG